MLRIPAGLRRRDGRRTAVLATLLIAATAINAIQFPAIEQRTPTWFSALHRAHTSNVLEIGYLESPQFRQQYGLHLALGQVAPGATILVPAGSKYSRPEFNTRLYGFGHVSAVVRVDPETVDRIDLDALGFEPAIVARGDGGRGGAPWALAVAAPVPGPGDPAEFVLEALRDGASPPAPDPAREFLIVQWHHPLPGAEYDYQDLVLETALLPPEIRGELRP